MGKALIVTPDVDDLPAAAATEQAHLRTGTAFAPCSSRRWWPASRSSVGLGYVANSAPRIWSRIFVEQSRLIADVFANAMTRKQAEDAVRSSEATKAAILASLASHVAVLDRVGAHPQRRPAWACTPATAPTVWATRQCHLDFWVSLEKRGASPSATRLPASQAVLTGSTRTASCSSTRARLIALHAMTVVPLRCPRVKPSVSLTDVTERKRAEIEAQKSRQELADFLRGPDRPATILLMKAEPAPHGHPRQRPGRGLSR